MNRSRDSTRRADREGCAGIVAQRTTRAARSAPWLALGALLLGGCGSRSSSSTEPGSRARTSVPTPEPEAVQQVLGCRFEPPVARQTPLPSLPSPGPGARRGAWVPQVTVSPRHEGHYGESGYVYDPYAGFMVWHDSDRQELALTTADLTKVVALLGTGESSDHWERASLRWSPDGSLLAGIAGHAAVRDLRRGGRARAPGEHRATALAWADTTTLVVLDPEGGVERLDVASGGTLSRLPAPEPVKYLPGALRPDGAFAARGVSSGVGVWDTRTGEVCGVVNVKDPRVIAFSDEGGSLAIASASEVLVVTLATGAQTRSTLPPQAWLGNSLLFRTDGSPRLASADGQVVLDLQGPEAVATPRPTPLTTWWTGRAQRVWLPGDRPRGLVVAQPGQAAPEGLETVRQHQSPDGRYLLTYGAPVKDRESQLELWDTVQGRRVAELGTEHSHADSVSFFFTPGGTAGYHAFTDTTGISGAESGRMREWDARTGKLLRSEPYPGFSGFSNPRNHWKTGCPVTTARDTWHPNPELRDARTGALRARLPPFASVDETNTRCDLATGYLFTGEPTEPPPGVLDLRSHRQLWSLPPRPSPQNRLMLRSEAWRPGHDELAFSQESGAITIHEGRTGRVLRTVPPAGELHGLSFSSRGGQLAVVSRAPSGVHLLRVVSMTDDTVIGPRELDGPFDREPQVHWTADDAVVVVGNEQGTLFHRVADGAEVLQQVFTSEGHLWLVSRSPDGAIDAPPAVERLFAWRHGNDLRCAAGYVMQPVGATRQHPGLLADLLAGRPIAPPEPPSGEEPAGCP